MPVYAGDYEHSISGVPGRMQLRTTKQDQKPGTWFHQTWVSTARPVSQSFGARAKMRVNLRFDDDCGNGHNSFAITADVFTTSPRKRHGYYSDEIIACGCLHEEIAKHFPELAYLIPWHLVSSDGPMHYIANTLYHAGDKDHYGLRKGETKPILNRQGEPRWKLVALNTLGVGISDTPTGDEYRHSETVPLFILTKHCDGQTPPLATPILKWVPETQLGEGKQRNLDFARSSAVWPEATDSQLCADTAELRAMLESRLPELLQRFRAAMDSCGFAWSPAGMTPVRE